ncbi:MAG: 16S rRNA (cytidine(1402)-2'-O)-methyltransferase [Syntrophobacterales bacterium]|jgi:16S rRNA (cytidine1402-2'-O)-methyltransferase|nr:16S rRNA (cytidine(1402)-2'-O)-methyltransferase [Syntrophobacterales bacterium]
MTTPGKLYIVATPIGNLEDITLRALRILKEVSLIAAEDTRRTRILLNHYDIQTPLTSLYEQNEALKSASLLLRLKEGKSVACVTDAGTPAISDPGYLLIRRAIDAGIDVIPIPGVSALITALCAAGLPTDHFVFHGFLPAKTAKRKTVIQALAEDTRTQVFYESPRRLRATLCALKEILGSRHIVVARELTKLHEEFIRGDLHDVLSALDERDIKGEVTLIVRGYQAQPIINIRQAISECYDKFSAEKGLSKRDLVDRIARELDLSRKIVYETVHQGNTEE